jgi:dephospho-CoA kinase
MVFGDPAQLQRLEDLLYPRLMKRSEVLIAAADAEPIVKAMVLDAPKLFEAGLDRLCDSVIFVDTLMSTRVRRVEQNRGWSERELIRRENRQTPLDQKRANADYVIVNHAGLDELREQVERVFSSVLNSFKR